MRYEEQKKIDYYNVSVISKTKDMEFQTTDEPNSFTPFVIFRKKDGSTLMLNDRDIDRIDAVPVYIQEPTNAS